MQALATWNKCCNAWSQKPPTPFKAAPARQTAPASSLWRSRGSTQQVLSWRWATTSPPGTSADSALPFWTPTHPRIWKSCRQPIRRKWPSCPNLTGGTMASSPPSETRAAATSAGPMPPSTPPRPPFCAKALTPAQPWTLCGSLPLTWATSASTVARISWGTPPGKKIPQQTGSRHPVPPAIPPPCFPNGGGRSRTAHRWSTPQAS